MLAGQRNTHFSPWSQLGQVQATRFSSRLLFGDAARALLASHSVVGAGVDAPLVLTVTTCHLPGSFGSCWICWPEREIASYLMAWKRDWELFVGEKRWGVIFWPARDIASYLLANQNKELFSGCQLSWVNNKVICRSSYPITQPRFPHKNPLSTLIFYIFSYRSHFFLFCYRQRQPTKTTKRRHRVEGRQFTHDMAYYFESSLWQESNTYL